MPWLDALLIVLAGTGAGVINTIVGSGTLITFPTLLFLGYPPLTANVSNGLGLVAGGISGSWGYRREIAGAHGTLRRLMPMSLAGAITGALLLLVLPPAAFRAIVPVLIGIALVLVLAGPRVQRRVAAATGAGTEPRWHAPVLLGGVFVAGAYGGYFGAAQGVLLIGLLSLLSREPLQRLNGWKNVLALIANLVSAAVFLVMAREHLNWAVAGLIALGSFTGGFIGATVGRRLSPQLLRAVIVTIGVVAIVKLVWFP